MKCLNVFRQNAMNFLAKFNRLTVTEDSDANKKSFEKNSKKSFIYS